jgi:FkbM family methyltransferase
MALATNRSERASVAGFLAALYVARAAPFDTYPCSRRVRLKGLTWNLGIRTSEIYILEEVFAHEMYDRLPAYVPAPGWFVVDAGANAGVFSVTSAARGAELVAIEPNHQCFERLVENLQVNGVAESVRPVHAALGRHSGAVALVVDAGGTTGGHVVDRPESGSDLAPWIRMCTLDEVLADDDRRIDLLKVDIEGAEVDALRGGALTLDRTDRIIYEYHSAELLSEMRSILDPIGLHEELQFVYSPADESVGEEEVGMVYASRNPAPGG